MQVVGPEKPDSYHVETRRDILPALSEPREAVSSLQSPNSDLDHSENISDIHRSGAQILPKPLASLFTGKTSEEKKTIAEGPIPSWVKTLVHNGNAVSAVANGIAALTTAAFKKGQTVSSVEKASEWVNRISFGANSIFNSVNGYFDKNIFNMFGYAGEFLITTLLPEKIMGLVRGLSFPTYQMRNILSSVKAFNSPKSFMDEFEMIKSRAGEALRMIVSPSTYNFHNLSRDGGKVSEMLLGAWGGILSATGVLSWALTGSTKLGGWIKGIGEAMIDAYQIAPIQWKSGKKFYISSGFAFLVGSICEIIGRQKNDDPIFRNLYFMGSSIGRMLMTMSNTAKESENQLEPNFAT